MVLGALLFVHGCENEAEPGRRVSTETNWFNACTVDDECTGVARCICRICTISCEIDADCATVPKTAFCASGVDFESSCRSIETPAGCPLEEGPDAGVGGAGADAGSSSDAGNEAGVPVVCEGDFNLFTVDALEAFLAMGCTEVTGHLAFAMGMTSLEAIAVERVGGTLTVASNPELRSLAGLERITQVGQLSVISNPLLTSLDPIPSWPQGAVVGVLNIQGNGALPQCEVDALDAYLGADCNVCEGNGSGTCN